MDDLRDYLLSFDPANETVSEGTDHIAFRADRARRAALDFRVEHGNPTDVLDRIWEAIPDEIWQSVMDERYGNGPSGEDVHGA